MEYQNISFQNSNGVGVIKLKRINVLNCFNFEMAKEVLSALNQLENNPKIRAVLLTGEGRAFCAGQDLEEATRENGPDIGEIIDHTYNLLVQKISNFKKPVSCDVNGVAAGAGANLAISCDVTFAAKSAKFIQSFINIGLVPDSGGTYNLPRSIGKQKAAGLMFSGEKITAQEAENMGMIYKMVDDKIGYQIAFDFAYKLSKQPTKSIGLIKTLLNKSSQNNLSQQLDAERKLQVIAAGTKDFQEGVNAFLEKRKPNYIGK